MTPNHYWIWFLTYILNWQVLLPTILTGLILGAIFGYYYGISPMSFAFRTILAGNLFDIVVIGSSLHIAHKPILPALIFLPSTYGILWLVYGVFLAMGARLSLRRSKHWLDRALSRARKLPPPTPPPT